MDPEKYVFPDTFEILELNRAIQWEFDNKFMNTPSYQESLKDLLKKERFLLVHQVKERFFLINATIKKFLESFAPSASYEEVLRDFALEAACEKEQIKPAMNTFFEAMKTRQILVSESHKGKYDKEKITKESLPVNSKIGEFIILEKLKTKSEVEIYLAKPIHNGKPVILKVLRKHCFKDEETLQVFEQEFRVMKEIGKHPNICQVHDYYQNKKDRIAYGVLEYVKGDSIGKSSPEGKKSRKLQQKLALGLQMLEAISHVHKKETVHGDIHTRNFLLLEEEPKIKLIDFGMSNHIQPRENEIVLYGGVNHFIPPEKLNKSSFEIASSPADYRSEVFQLAVTLFIFIYGHRPFQAFTWKGLREEILFKDPIFEKQLPSTLEWVPVPIIDILKKALNKNPKLRYASATEMCEAWRKVIKKDSPSIKHSDSIIY